MNKLWLIIITGLLVRMIPALNGVITADVKYHWVYVMQFLNSPSSVLHLYGAVKNLYHNTQIADGVTLPPGYLFQDEQGRQFADTRTDTAADERPSAAHSTKTSRCARGSRSSAAAIRAASWAR